MTAISPDAGTPTTSAGGWRQRITDRLPHVRPAAFGGGLGLFVIGLGLLAIGIGWNGAAGAGGQVNHVTDLRAQLPWLISGGILGLALVVFGAALVIVHNARTDRARLEAKLDEVVDALAQGRGAASIGLRAPSSAADLFVAGGASYHLPECRLVEGRDDVSYLTATEVAERDLRACRVCKPAAAETLSR